MSFPIPQATELQYEHQQLPKYVIGGLVYTSNTTSFTTSVCYSFGGKY